MFTPVQPRSQCLCEDLLYLLIHKKYFSLAWETHKMSSKRKQFIKFILIMASIMLTGVKSLH